MKRSHPHFVILGFAAFFKNHILVQTMFFNNKLFLLLQNYFLRIIIMQLNEALPINGRTLLASAFSLGFSHQCHNAEPFTALSITTHLNFFCGCSLIFFPLNLTKVILIQQDLE